MRATLINFAFFLSLNGFVLLPLHIQELGGTEIEIGIIMGVYSGVEIARVGKDIQALDWTGVLCLFSE